MGDRVIFLDIDGVLSMHTDYRTLTPTLDAGATRRLVEVANATQARLVLISTWRFRVDSVRLLTDWLGGHGLVLEVANPAIRNRQLAIDAWLEANPEADWIVIDDMPLPYGDRHIQPAPDIGLADEHVPIAIARLLSGPGGSD